MPTQILVGFDGRAQARDALALARRLTLALEAELSVAVVLPSDPVDALDPAPYDAALDAHFDELLDLAAEQLYGLAIHRHRLRGTSPAAELAGLAERLDAFLLVVGSTHRGVLGRVHPGAVGGSLLSAASCPVGIAPRGYESVERSRFDLVGVGFDGRRETLAALEFAASLARDLDVGLRVLAGLTYRLPLRSELASPLDARGAERERLEQALAAAAETLSASAAVELADAEPADLLVERSEQLDLLVLGSRGYGPIKQVLLGGVSGRVVREARCPVLVVPRASI